MNENKIQKKIPQTRHYTSSVRYVPNDSKKLSVYVQADIVMNFDYFCSMKFSWRSVNLICVRFTISILELT